MPKLVVSPNWTLAQQDNFLIVSGGADEQYAIEGTAADVKAVLDLASNDFAALQNVSKNVQKIVSELQKSNIVYELKPELSHLKAHIVWVGSQDQALAKKLESHAMFTLKDEAGIIVYVRTDGLIQDFLEKRTSSKPHIYIDVSMHHTISLGPLVFPGETACLYCFLARVNKHWGDVKPPQQPAILLNTDLIVGFIVAELAHVAEGDYSLIESTAAYDIRNRRCGTGKVFKLPWCKWCKQESSDGKLDLPWINDSPSKSVR